MNRNAQGPEMRNGIVWQRQPDDFATRIEMGDVSGFINQEVVIEPGTNAILITDGVNQGVVAPGRYMLSSLGDKLGALVILRQAKQVSAIVVDTNAVDLPFRVENVPTKDYIPLSVELNVVLCVPAWEKGQPRVQDFFMNVMKGRRRFTLQDIQDHLQPEVENAVAEFLHAYTASQIDTDLSTKRLLAEKVRAHLNNTLAREGFSFQDVRAARVFNVQRDAQGRAQGELELQVTKEEADLQGRKRLFDVRSQADLQTLSEETQRIDQYEKRAVLNVRMRKAVSSDKMDEVRSEEDFNKFMDEIDRQHLLREDERAKLLAEYKANREDRERARAHLLARLDVEQRYELLMLEAERKGGLDQQQLKAQENLARQQVDFEQEAILRRTQGEIEVRRAREAYDREAVNIAAADLRAKMIEDAKARAQVEATQTQSDIEAGKAGWQLIIYMKETKLVIEDKRLAMERLDQRERDLHTLEIEQRRLEMALLQKRTESEIRMTEQRQAQEYELRRMQEMGKLSAEAMIALSPAEQGNLIKDLQNTKAFANMTEEQIMAATAAGSPAVAQALTEKYKAAAAQGSLSAEQKVLYDRLLAVQAEGSKSTLDAMKETMHMQQEMALKMGEMIRDVGTSKPGTSVPPVIIVGGGGSGVVTQQPLDSASQPQPKEVAVCPKCGYKSPIGVKFCSNCGHQFYQ